MIYILAQQSRAYKPVHTIVVDERLLEIPLPRFQAAFGVLRVGSGVRDKLRHQMGRLHSTSAGTVATARPSLLPSTTTTGQHRGR